MARQVSEERMKKIANLLSKMKGTRLNNPDLDRLEERDVQYLEMKQRIVYNQNGYITKLFEKIHKDFQSKDIISVHREDYLYDLSPLSISETEFSHLIQLTLLYQEKVNHAPDNDDIKTVVTFNGVKYGFFLHYSPTMPEIISILDKDDTTTEVLSLETIFTKLAEQYPERDSWTKKDLYQ